MVVHLLDNTGPRRNQNGLPPRLETKSQWPMSWRQMVSSDGNEACTKSHQSSRHVPHDPATQRFCNASCFMRCQQLQRCKTAERKGTKTLNTMATLYVWGQWCYMMPFRDSHSNSLQCSIKVEHGRHWAQPGKVALMQLVALPQRS